MQMMKDLLPIIWAALLAGAATYAALTMTFYFIQEAP